MNLLVSDYDGTLKPDVKILMKNIKAINRFRKNGHIFMIATGRNFVSIKKEIEKFNIPYDFLSCNDGAILFDNKDQILYKDPIAIDIIKQLLEDLKQFAIIKDVKMYGTHDEVTVLDEVLELALFTKLFKSKKELYHFIALNYPELFCMNFPDAMFIEKKGGKSRSIRTLEQLIKFDNIITVGDSRNDLEMLKDYNGYKVLESYPCLYGKNIKTCTSVKSLVKKII